MKDEGKKSKADRLHFIPHPSAFILLQSYCSARTRRKPRTGSRKSCAIQRRAVAVIASSPPTTLLKEPPRTTNLPRSLASIRVLSLPLYNEASVPVHSQTLPIMSATPCGVFPCG